MEWNAVTVHAWMQKVVNGRERIAAAVIVALFVTFAVITASQRYTVADPWKLYVTTVREYLAAALRGDSSGVARRSAGAEPSAWVLDAAGRRPAVISAWAGQLETARGERRGDTVALLLRTDDNVEGCSRLNSVSALLLDDSSSPRVLAISSACLGGPPVPALAW